MAFNFSTLSGTLYGGRTGPKTPQGKAIAARNATSHGLFARDIVLPSLGEDPEIYNILFIELCEQIEPRNLIERHYVEEIAAASWRLRRLHRWQAQVWEDETLTEDERLDKLDRVVRHETTLHRQIDKSVRLLGRDVPLLFEGRARKQALADLHQTERTCRTDEEADLDVAERVHEYLQLPVLVSTFDRSRLDNTYVAPPPDNPPLPETPVAVEKPQNCQNEMAPSETVPNEITQICQNEITAATITAADDCPVSTVVSPGSTVPQPESVKTNPALPQQDCPRPRSPA